MKYIAYICIAFLLSCTSKNEVFDIHLVDMEENNFQVSSISKNNLSVFYFLAPECPLSQNYTKAMNELYEAYHTKGVTFYGVYCGKVYTEEEMASFIEDYEMKFLFLKDVKYTLSSELGATITPEAFMLNNKGEILYSGKIDNWMASLGVKRQVITEYYLKDAIEQSLAGKEIKIAKTEAIGCILE